MCGLVIASVEPGVRFGVPETGPGPCGEDEVMRISFHSRYRLTMRLCQVLRTRDDPWLVPGRCPGRRAGTGMRRQPPDGPPSGSDVQGLDQWAYWCEGQPQIWRITTNSTEAATSPPGNNSTC